MSDFPWQSAFEIRDGIFASQRRRNATAEAQAMHRSNRSTCEVERGQQAQASSSSGGAWAGASSPF